LATVRNHVQNLLGKLGVHSRLQAVAHATNHGLL
ncbi:MAG TPA: LuxR C-terminal-related transcriptional regulator, partial [Methylomirabilota bacterium]|nr:LuxR C-terminal-related transcriptional regulator [Methylomirabilota bacterium]